MAQFTQDGIFIKMPKYLSIPQYFLTGSMSEAHLLRVCNVNILTNERVGMHAMRDDSRSTMSQNTIRSIVFAS